MVVKASPWLEDNQWALDLAAHEPFIVGFVGTLPVGTKEFAGHLNRFAANKLFRGIRLRDRKLEGTLDNPVFLNDLKLLADHDLSLDMVGGREILPFADRLAKEMPKLRIIIDHLAGVVVDGKEPPADWVKDMRAMARRPNIYCKLSGFVEVAGRSNGSAPGDVEFYLSGAGCDACPFRPRTADVCEQLAGLRAVCSARHRAGHRGGLLPQLRTPSGKGPAHRQGGYPLVRREKSTFRPPHQ